VFKPVEMHFLGEVSRPVEVWVVVCPVDTFDKENMRLRRILRDLWEPREVARNPGCELVY
jgi:uncharacterized metal-binding protein